MAATYDFIYHERPSRKMQYDSGWQSSAARYDIVMGRALCIGISNQIMYYLTLTAMYIWLILYVDTIPRRWPWKDADEMQNVASEYKPDKPLHSKSGTLAYLAPEVYAGTGYLTEVDWWSLGVTFYECIYNKVSLPLTGNVQRLIRIIATFLFTWPRKVGKGNTESLAQLPCNTTPSLDTLYTRHAIIIGEGHAETNRGNRLRNLYGSFLLPANRLRSSRKEADPASICTIQ